MNSPYGGAVTNQTDLTLDEELFLLSRHPDSGRDMSSVGSDAPLAGAVLIGLAEAGAITIADGRVQARPVRLASPLLQAALGAISAEPRPRRAKHWVRRLPGTLDLQVRLGVGLSQRGVLRDERTSVLGIGVKRFPEAAPAVRAEILARVVPALTGTGPDPAPRIRLLAGLLGPADLVKKVVPSHERRAAGKRAKAFLAEAPVGSAVADVTAAAQQAVMAAVLASVAASSASSAGGDGGGGGSA